MESLVLQVPLLLLLLVVAFFASGETALFSLSRVQKRRLEKEPDGRSRAARRLLNDPTRVLSSILLGNTVAQVAFTVLTTQVAIAEFGSAAGLALGALGSVLVLLLAGEIVPKIVAAANPLAFARLLAPPLAASHRLLSLVTTPAHVVSRQVAVLIAGKAPLENDLPENSTPLPPSRGPEPELLELLDDFQQTVAREVMTPRVEMISGDLDWPSDRIRQFVRKARTSRIPFYRGNLDNIEGILEVKPYLLAHDPVAAASLAAPYFIPEGKKIADLLRDFQRRELEMAIVLDEHGQTTGLVTLEDILEEIVGEVYDEGEQEEPAIRKLPDGGWQVPGRALLDDVEREIGLVFEADEGIDTLAGLVMNYLGEIPKTGDSFILSNHSVTITKVVRHRVKDVLIQRLVSLRDSAVRASAAPIAPVGDS